MPGRQVVPLIPMIPRQQTNTIVSQDTVNMGVGATLTFGTFDASGYGRLYGLLFTEFRGVLNIEWSLNDLLFDWIDVLRADILQPTVSQVAGGYRFSVPVTATRVRIRYVNGDTIADTRLECNLIPI